MGLRDEFADAVDGIRDLQFHATRVSRGNFRILLWWSFVSFSLRVCYGGKMRSRMFFTNSVGPANDPVKAGNS
jgi:hypothetical protein